MDLISEYLKWAATQSVNSGSGTMDECRGRNDSLRFCEVDPEEIAEDFDEDLSRGETRRGEMTTIVSSPESKEFTPAPEGLHQAVCVDVLDVWQEERPQEYGGGIVDKTRLVWEIDARMDDGRRFTVSQFYTASLHEKANLRRDLESWRGRAFTEAELNGFDLENVVGVSCQLQVIHHTNRQGKTYANVKAIVPLAKDAPQMVPSGEYTRVKDREKKGPESADESVPF